MKTITIIRHGKANTGATDHLSYDKLSEMGEEQSRLMGAHVRETKSFRRVISGTLNRHRQTVEAAAFGLPYRQDARLNELPYFELGKEICVTHNLEFPKDDQSFCQFFRLMMEEWDAIAARKALMTRAQALTQLFDLLSTLDEEDLVISSGGVIGLLGSEALSLDPQQTATFVMPISHTSIHRFGYEDRHVTLRQYCGTPHLDQRGQGHLLTYA